MVTIRIKSPTKKSMVISWRLQPAWPSRKKHWKMTVSVDVMKVQNLHLLCKGTQIQNSKTTPDRHLSRLCLQFIRGLWEKHHWLHTKLNCLALQVWRFGLTFVGEVKKQILVAGSNPLRNILVKLGILPQVGVQIKNVWNHHLVI